jgi:hypothetical protein
MSVFVRRDDTRFGMAWDVNGLQGSATMYFYVGDDPDDDEHIRTKPFFCCCVGACRNFDFYNCRATDFTGNIVSR